jgi:hypothetical protein
MKRIVRRSIQEMTAMMLLLALIVGASLDAAAGPRNLRTIGMATAAGSFRVDGLVVENVATLFEGTSVETTQATSVLRLPVADVALAGDSMGRVYAERLVLERGKAQWAGGRMLMEAGPVRVTGAGQDAKALVVRNGDVVEVAALSGAVKVTNLEGLVVADLVPGLAYAFAAQAGAQGPPAPPEDPNKKNKRRAAGVPVGGAKIGGMALGTKVVVAGLVATAIAVPSAVVARGGQARTVISR